MVINLQIAQSAGVDAANRQMISEGRKVWNEADYDLASRTTLDLFPLCAEGYGDVCNCSLCKIERLAK